MSADILQKSREQDDSHYFERGDISKYVTMNDHLGDFDCNEVRKEIRMLLAHGANLDQQHQQQPHRHHGGLTRTISQPAQLIQQQQQQHQQQQQQQPAVASLVTITENLGNMNLHRKLERTQSEPLPPQQPMNTSRYKTELCRPFEEAGECKYGEKCQFAHGSHELRNVHRHPKYKTEYCRTFHSVGFCPYGPRCHFVHNADEARAQQAAQAAKSSTQSQSQSQQSSSQNFSPKSNQSSNQSSNSSSSSSSSGGGGGGGNSINNNNGSQFYLPLSPPLSMSTGSDRESPTGSLSLSPTNSLTSFPFHDALQHGYLASNGAKSNSSASSTSSASGMGLGMSMGIGQGMIIGQGLGMGHHGPATPPESPNVPISPVHTPPPYDVVVSGSGAGNNSVGSKQLLQKSVSTPMQQEDTPRLPVFNRLSSGVEAYQQQSNLGL
uniref:Protein TIS11 n=2 Tax=Drosophila melanogaster TaxID=7227 RepID=TIS11_DROME|eukprot:NP_001259490.1 Tis11 zinc finger protein, isoform C [Drosophila melanogaster]